MNFAPHFDKRLLICESKLRGRFLVWHKIPSALCVFLAPQPNGESVILTPLHLLRTLRFFMVQRLFLRSLRSLRPLKPLGPLKSLSALYALSAASCHDCREAGGWHLPLFSTAPKALAPISTTPPDLPFRRGGVLWVGLPKVWERADLPTAQNRQRLQFSIPFSAFGSGKNARCEAKARRTKKAGPQFAYRK